MLDAIAVLADAVLNLVIWDKQMRRELRERHPMVFVFSIVTVLTAVGLLAAVLLSLFSRS